MRRILIFLILVITYFASSSSKVAPKSLRSMIEESDLIVVGDVTCVKNQSVELSNIEHVLIKDFKKKDVYRICAKNIEQSYRLPGKEGKYLVLSMKNKTNLKNRNLLCVFRIIDNQILITNPFLKDLYDCGFSTKGDIHEEFRNANLKNTISDGMGVLLSIDDFKEVIKEIHSGNDYVAEDDGSIKRAVLCR